MRDKPFIQGFFRLEEEHIRSSECEIVVPAFEWKEEMYQHV
jgi:hypothetical protein